MPMPKPVRAFVVVLCLVAIVWAAARIVRQRGFQAKLDAANAIYESAKTAEEMEKAKQAYMALLPQASAGKEKRAVEGAMASCDANIAYDDATGQSSDEKYRRAIELMEKAKELTGDPEGVWAERIQGLNARLRGSLGPTAEEMQARFDKDAKMPFEQAQGDLEGLYRWKQLWREKGTYQGDAAREAIFAKVQQHLLDNYSRIFEERVRAAQSPAASLEIKAAPLPALGHVERFDAARAKAYAEKYAAILAEARKAAAELAKEK